MQFGEAFLEHHALGLGPLRCGTQLLFQPLFELKTRRHGFGAEYGAFDARLVLVIVPVEFNGYS